jgi:hypothetical protein
MSDFIVEITPELEAAYRRTHMLQARAVRAMIHAKAQPQGLTGRGPANGPAAQIRALALGESVLLTQYKDTTRISALIASIRKSTGCDYCSRKQRSLIDGSVEGVLVSRVE